MSTNEHDDLINLYRTRLQLHLPPTHDELQPNLSTLRLLTERHLQFIPFENIALHCKTNTSTSSISSSSNNNNKQRNKIKRAEYHNLNEHEHEHESESEKRQEKYSPINLSRSELIQKLLIESRGGCCLELNGLFSMLLDEIGYKSVVLVPCFASAGKGHGHRNKTAKFRVTASHFVLLVTIDERFMDMEKDMDTEKDIERDIEKDIERDMKETEKTNAFFSPTCDKSNSFVVDVGLGEPSLWPLEYVLDKEQSTPDGMRSRMVWDRPWIDGQGRKRQCIVLEWLIGGIGGEGNEEEWEPRLQWDINDAPLLVSEKYDSLAMNNPRLERLTLDSFHYVIPMLLNPKSNCTKKLIVCKLTREQKVTLAGRCFKITSPRFGPSSHKVVRDLETEDEVYAVLQNEFGIIVESGKLLLPSLQNSKKSKLWDHL